MQQPVIPPEEELIRLLKFGTSRKIRDLISANPTMDLHYPLAKNLTTPLTAAVERSDSAILTTLIDKIPGNLDATLTQPCGKTALMHAACYARNSEVLLVLVKKGADPSKTDINGWNCLFYAVIGKRLQNVIALLDSQVSIESRDLQGRTPLMISAVYLSDLDMFHCLLSRGADVEALDNNGLSALHLAILRKRRECVIELSQRNAAADLLTPVSRATTQQLVEEIMSDVLPVHGKVQDFAEEL
ncbi:hypothetical protein TSAR_007028 [Trichomalopsis sarcophagae]|uniref:Uncharacterized protein n=1 Tax=Trichomalopsis sarcophagae TaxID=543379 RepID=A0A232EIN3_9HYME|nr:hypothetical protein TSAR_007028 [Trichomalopsis sarcophagae]